MTGAIGAGFWTRYISGSLATVVLLVLLWWHTEIASHSVVTLAPWATALSFAAAFVIGRTARTGLWSSGFYYVVILALFHLALCWLITFGIPFDPTYLPSMSLWFSDHRWVPEAVYLSMVAVTAFTLAHLLANKPRERVKEQRPAPQSCDRAGLRLVSLGALVTIGYILRTAPGLLFGGTYQEFNTTVAGSTALALGMLLVACGVILAAASPKSPTRKRALVVFGLYTLVMLSFGARTAVMYAVVAGLVAAARTHPMPRARVALTVIIVGILGIGVLAQLRSTGISGATFSAATASPSSTLTETGGSLRPVAETLVAHQLGMPFRHGETYVVGLERIYERAAGLPRPNPDPRFAATFLQQQVTDGQIGYSAVAEGYENFGTAGVVGFFLLVGLLLGRFDGGPLGDPITAARLGVLTYALTYEVRQASNILLTVVVIGFLVVEVAHRIDVRRRDERNRLDKQRRKERNAARLRANAVR